MSCGSFYFGTRIKYEVQTKSGVYLQIAGFSCTDYCSDNGTLQNMCSVVLVLPHCAVHLSKHCCTCSNIPGTSEVTHIHSLPSVIVLVPSLLL
jgi:hypothetical protein